VTAISTAAAATPRRTRCVWSPAERAEWLALFERSGKSPSEFCRENDLAEATLSLWRRQQRHGEEGAAEDGGFVEIPVARLSAPVEHTEGVPALIVRAGGMTFEFAAGTDPAWLARVLRAVQVGA
jgi:transposase-like protein